MSDASNSSTARRNRPGFHWRQLALKELRETLRDRRTLVTLIVMPLLVYPILSLIFRSFLASNIQLLPGGDPVVWRFVYTGDGEADETQRMLSQLAAVVEQQEQAARAGKAENDPPDEYVPFRLHQWELVTDSTVVVESSTPIESGESNVEAEDDAENLDPAAQREAVATLAVRSGIADAGLILTPVFRQPWRVGDIKIIFRNDAVSQAAASYLRERLELINQRFLDEKLAQHGLPVRDALTLIDQQLKSPDDARDEGGFSLAALIPLILVLMTITGAVYPAIDLTAGEKERGTLEALMAAPLPRIGILFAKFIAVMTVAVLTAALNMLGMAVTVWVFQLDQFLTGSSEFTLLIIIKVFFLLVLFAAFFSALLLAITSYARSFKEAQAYLIPVILLSMGPGLLAMTPGLKLTSLWAMTPMVNLLLLARDVIQNQVVVIPALLAIISTLAYAGLAMMWAARSFGSDAILYQTHGSFGEMFTRPARSQSFVATSVVVFCLVLLFPLNFVMIGFLGRLPAENVTDLGVRFGLMGMFTFFSFWLFPTAVAIYQRANVADVFGVKRPRVVYWIAAILLGLSLWPLVMGFAMGWEQVYGWLAGADARAAWHNRLVDATAEQVARIRQLSPILIAVTLAVVPAVCEEWFFRGMLLRSLLRVRSAMFAIVVSAVVFGLFHVLSGSVIALERMLPTMLVGMVLGFLAVRSGSVLPGMLLHAIHNACVSFLAYYQPQLSRFDWFPAEDKPVPMSWIAAGVVVAGMGIGLIISGRKR